MTDLELRMDAARLMGWSGIGIWEEYNQPYGIPPDGWNHRDAPSIGVSSEEFAEYLLLNYPNDIAAAWELINRLEELGYETILVNCADDNLKAVRVVHGVAAPFAPKDTLDHPSYHALKHAFANVQDEIMARAITRAFIETVRKQGEVNNVRI